MLRLGYVKVDLSVIETSIVQSETDVITGVDFLYFLGEEEDGSVEAIRCCFHGNWWQDLCGNLKKI